MCVCICGAVTADQLHSNTTEKQGCSWELEPERIRHFRTVHVDCPMSSCSNCSACAVADAGCGDE
jgi:hypothetical protein